MKFKSFLLLVPFVVLFLGGCKESEEPEIKEDSKIRLIHATVSELVIPENGSVELPFFIEDADVPINYNVSSPECQIFIRLATSMIPDNFRLESISLGDSAGRYVARLTDTGKNKIYSEKVKLGVIVRSSSTGREILLSNEVSVLSELAKERPYGFFTGLPFLIINTEDGQAITSDQEYKKATVTIDGLGDYPSLEETAIEIRGRGNTTWGWPKKPYLFRFEQRTSVMGMPKHKRWVLLANFMDRTLMRNAVALKVGSMTSLSWTPRQVQVELILNGRHMGNYMLIEQVRVDKNRVNITEMQPTDIAGDALSGGYLLELDFHYDNKNQWLDAHGRCNQFGNGIPFAVKSPDDDVLNPLQYGWVKDYINTVAGALYGPNFTDSSLGYAQYLDMQSFVDYWIIFEVMGNHELGNPGSVFFHKERGGLLTAGPMWDFDWGVLSYYTSPQAKTGLVNRNAIWYKRMFDDPAFRALLRERWEVLKPQLETIPAYIDQMKTYLGPSAELNFKMWNPAQDAVSNGGHIINGDENMSFSDAVARLRANYLERIAVIDRSI